MDLDELGTNKEQPVNEYERLKHPARHRFLRIGTCVETDTSTNHFRNYHEDSTR